MNQVHINTARNKSAHVINNLLLRQSATALLLVRPHENGQNVVALVASDDAAVQQATRELAAGDLDDAGSGERRNGEGGDEGCGAEDKLGDKCSKSLCHGHDAVPGRSDFLSLDGLTALEVMTEGDLADDVEAGQD